MGGAITVIVEILRVFECVPIGIKGWWSFTSSVVSGASIKDVVTSNRLSAEVAAFPSGERTTTMSNLSMGLGFKGKLGRFLLGDTSTELY